MSTTFLIVAVFVVIVGLAVWNWQRTGEQKAALAQAGFEISDRLGGSPELVADRARRELALVRPGGYERLPMADFEHAELASSDRPEAEGSFRLELIFKGGRALRVDYGLEHDAQRALENLLKLVKDQ